MGEEPLYRGTPRIAAGRVMRAGVERQTKCTEMHTNFSGSQGGHSAGVPRS